MSYTGARNSSAGRILRNLHLVPIGHSCQSPKQQAAAPSVVLLEYLAPSLLFVHGLPALLMPFIVF